VSLDYEVASVAQEAAQEFILHVEDKIGRKVVLYSGNTIKEALGNTVVQFWAERRLWLAMYAKKWIVQASWTAPWLWQFTGDGLAAWLGDSVMPWRMAPKLMAASIELCSAASI
jgi:GH25 family lysozyme M1 (1,4-beta-N-acetylmuramidase)